MPGPRKSSKETSALSHDLSRAIVYDMKLHFTLCSKNKTIYRDKNANNAVANTTV